jgi:hypothetical protein
MTFSTCVGIIGGVHDKNSRKIVILLNRFKMSLEYVLNSNSLTFCSSEITIFVLLKLCDQILHLLLVISACLFNSLTCIVHLFYIR